MGCTEPRFICYNSQREKNKKNNELQKSEINYEIEEENYKNEESQIINHKEEMNKNSRKNIKIQNKKKESKDLDDNKEPIQINNLEMQRELNLYLQTKNNPNFNFPEVKEEKYVGKGLKRMKGYISIVQKDELIKKRKAFWGSRVEGNKKVWKFLKELCELPTGEEKNIESLLEANEIKPLLKCINITYDKNGAVYEIPNYCINDPISYDLPEMHSKKKKHKKIHFYARKDTKQIKIKSSNTSYIEEVKEKVSKEFKINKSKIRMFFGGKELKNGVELWKYNIDDDCVIIVL